MTGPGLRERHKQTTRQALVDAALRLFDERGYGEVTVEDTCAEADVSPRTFFRYFPAKEQILAVPITALLDLLRDVLHQQPADQPVWPSLATALRTAVVGVEDDRDAFLRAGRVIRQAPSALASSARALMEWELTVRDEITQRLGTPAASLTGRLLLGVAMVALRAALDQWSESGGAGSAVDLLDRALAAVDTGARAIEAGAVSIEADTHAIEHRS